MSKKTEPAEHARFREGLAKIVTVPNSEVKKLEAEWKKRKDKQRRPPIQPA